MYATYIVYNNEPTIRRSLESIFPYVEKVIAVDGAYSNFPHEKPQSTDGTKELFHELCEDKLIWVDCEGEPWPTQIGKRSEYVKRVPDGRWFMVMDGDMIIKGKIREGFRFAENSDHTCIGIRLINRTPLWDGPYADSGRHKYALIPEDAWKDIEWEEVLGVAPSLHKKRENMKYLGHHSRLRVNGRITWRTQAVLEDVWTVNLNKEMGWERWQANLEYKTKNPTH